MFFSLSEKQECAKYEVVGALYERKILKKVLLFIGLLMASAGLAAEGINVVDGDSLEAGNERLRLMNIDAPEFFQKCYDASGWKYLCGFEATEYLKKLMQGQVRCERYGKDRYGRSLVECWRADGVNIGQEMVRSGWATAYNEKYQADEKQARAAKKGIWRGKFMRPELYRALKRSHETLKNEKR